MSLIHVATFFDHAEYQRTRWKSNEEHSEMPLDWGLVIPKTDRFQRAQKETVSCKKREMSKRASFPISESEFKQLGYREFTWEKVIFLFNALDDEKRLSFHILVTFLKQLCWFGRIKKFTSVLINARVFSSDWGGYLRYAIDSQLHCFVIILPAVFYGPNIHWKQTCSADQLPNFKLLLYINVGW